MTEAAAFFKKFKDGLVGGLNTCAIGRIQTYDPIKSKADVELLPDGELIKSVPVAMPQTSQFYIRIPYQKGDHVLVVFAQREIDGVMYQSNNPPSNRMLAVDDAIVISGINLFTDDLPADNTNALVLGEKGGGAKIVIGNGEIKLIGNKITANGEDLTSDDIGNV